MHVRVLVASLLTVAGLVVADTGAGAQTATPDVPVTVSSCPDPGTDGPRVQLVVVSLPGRSGHVTDDAARQGAYAADATLDAGTRRHDPDESRRIRWATTPDCTPIVERIVVDGPTSTRVTNWEALLRDAGMTRPDRIYMVIAPVTALADKSLCGFASGSTSGPTVEESDAGHGPRFSVVVCWLNSTILHELLHNLGAVQAPSPNRTAGNHCTDGPDVMCYPDGHGAYRHDVCEQPAWIDCNADDYFDPSPEPGSFLTENFNTADSPYLWPNPAPAAYNTTFAQKVTLHPQRAGHLWHNEVVVTVEAERGARLIARVADDNGWVEAVPVTVTPDGTAYAAFDVSEARGTTYVATVSRAGSMEGLYAPMKRAPLRGAAAPTPVPRGHGTVCDSLTSSFECAREHQILRGDSDGDPMLDQHLTRGQLTSVIARVAAHLGAALPEHPRDAFDDDTGSVHEHASNQLAAAGLLHGTSTRVLAGPRPATRAQHLALLHRVLDSAGVIPVADTGLRPADFFSDDTGSVHEAGVNAAAEHGVTYAARRALEGSAPVLRRDAATVISAAIDLAAERAPADAG